MNSTYLRRTSLLMDSLLSSLMHSAHRQEMFARLSQEKQVIKIFKSPGVISSFSEINAAATISALVFSGKFDLTSTYFFIAGIAGISPEVGTLASVTFARYAVQVALQYELDSREMPSNFTTGYVPQGATAVGQYPTIIYGTEVFEVNDALRQLAIGYAKTANLNDSADAIAYRANYNTSPEFAAATARPSVIACDVATADVYFSGKIVASLKTFDDTDGME